jgi:hypothetical protein
LQLCGRSDFSSWHLLEGFIHYSFAELFFLRVVVLLALVPGEMVVMYLFRVGRLYGDILTCIEFQVCILYVNIIILCESVKWKCRKSFFQASLIYDL